MLIVLINLNKGALWSIKSSTACITLKELDKHIQSSVNMFTYTIS